jgi:hypothetical protein
MESNLIFRNKTEWRLNFVEVYDINTFLIYTLRRGVLVKTRPVSIHTVFQPL